MTGSMRSSPGTPFDIKPILKLEYHDMNFLSLILSLIVGSQTEFGHFKRINSSLSMLLKFTIEHPKLQFHPWLIVSPSRSIMGWNCSLGCSMANFRSKHWGTWIFKYGPAFAMHSMRHINIFILRYSLRMLDSWLLRYYVKTMKIVDFVWKSYK